MLLLFLTLIGLAGWVASSLLEEELESHTARIATALLLSVILLIAIAWVLSLAGFLEANWLLGLAFLSAVIVTGLRVRRRTGVTLPLQDTEQGEDSPQSPLRLITPAVLILVALSWTAFLLWKGWVAPPHSHDAAVYHLPRAALLATTGEYQRFDYSDDRIDSLPANYELILAVVLILDGDDRIVEWVNTVLFLGFLLLAAAFSRRWWGDGQHSMIVALLFFTMPLFLLHGAAIKNDLLVTFLITSSLYWAGKWIERPSLTATSLTVVSACAAAGTKPQGLIIGATITLIWLIASIARKSRLRTTLRSALVALAVTIVAFPLLGGIHYLPKTGSGEVNGDAALEGYSSGYGQWRYLWQAPVMMFVAPFSGSDRAVRPPWGGRSWFWPRWDVHDSNWGIVVSLLALLLPISVWKSRSLRPDRALERFLISLAVLIASLVILPSQSWISGYISAYPRYLMFVPLFLVLLTLPPLLAQFSAGRDRDLISSLIAVTLAALFVSTGTEAAVEDRYGPLRDIRWAADHPGVRFTPMMANRATVVVDRFAGPTDSIDVYGGNDSWIYPAMGSELKRDLRFVDGIQDLRPDADWVIVDQLVHVVWGEISDIREWQYRLHRNPPREQDLAFIDTLANDPAFEPVYIDRRLAQAVFRRRD